MLIDLSNLFAGLPRPQIDQSKLSVRAGESCQLQCTVKDSENSQIDWLPVGGGTLTPRATVRQGTLYFDRVTAADAGFYKCVATNAAGYAEATSELIVLGERGRHFI